ncbi:hypothetical protein [Flavobacterium sp.]|uniref:hypothetical protein n=1 Tax=Flavobacterium sp. TaxID=239 RepID=UPI0022BD4F77|nr:hypothetical protein [Flavobacterium sp.]MCZ8090973.1 hypothetical protein [Flavobacterium sp.]
MKIDKREKKIDCFSFFDKGNAISIVSKNSDSLSFNPDGSGNPFLIASGLTRGD